MKYFAKTCLTGTYFYSLSKYSVSDDTGKSHFSKNISPLGFENFFYSLVYAYRYTYHNFSYWDMSMNPDDQNCNANTFVTLLNLMGDNCRTIMLESKSE